MEDKRRSYLIWSIAAAVLFLLCAFMGDLFHVSDLKSVMGYLSDCFVIPGVVFAGAGAISWAGTFGVYDMLSYGFSMVWNQLVHPKKQFPNYMDYKDAKNEKREWNREMLVVGVICLGFSFISLILYFLL